MKRPLVVHPFLVALAPVCFLLGRNIAEVPLSDAVRPVCLVLALALVLLLAARLVARDWQKAALLVSLGLLILFSYGHIGSVLDGKKLGGVLIGRPVVYLGGSAIVFLAGAVLVLRIRRSVRGLTQFANIAAACFVVISLGQIVVFELKRPPARAKRPLPEKLMADVELPANPGSRPTIYYIIADAYGRQDVLKEFLGFDNSAFIEYLRAKGFYVAARSRSNYCQTRMSLASSLNMRHMHRCARYHRRMIQESCLVRALRAQGYRFVTVASGCPLTEIRDADLFFETARSPTPFEIALLNMTPVPAVLYALSHERIQPVGYELHRRRILYAFDRLAEVPTLEGPVFVFAHIVAPHAPFVFNEDGTPVAPGKPFSLNLTIKERRSPATYDRPYARQLVFINVKLMEMIDTILATSAEPPIIIIQGDHGPGSTLDPDDPDKTNMRERMSILNAYYFPDGDYSALYDDITPVNTFRVVLDKYFGAGLELLGDQSYFHTWVDAYKFYDVTEAATSDGRFKRAE